MGMIKNDINDVTDALINGEGREPIKVAQRLIEAGMALLHDNGGLTEDMRFVPDFKRNGEFASYSTARRRPAVTLSEIDHLRAAFGQMSIKPSDSFLVVIDETGDLGSIESLKTPWRVTTGEAAVVAEGTMIAVLREAGETFDGYARNHLDKSPPQHGKARRNMEMAEKCYGAIGEDYPGIHMPEVPAEIRGGAERGSMLDWEADVKAAQEAEPSPTGFEGDRAFAEPSETAEIGSLTPATALEGAFAPGSKADSPKALLRAIFDAMEAGAPAKGVDVHVDDRPALDTMVNLKLVTRDDVSDILGVSLEARLMLGIRPRGTIDLPVEVAEITGNVAEAELVARYCESKIAAIDKAIAKREAPMYDINCSWEESYGHAAMMLRAMASEFRQGLHVPTIHGEARIIPYNEDRSTGISHRVALDTFFDDVHQRNVMAGWWTDIATGQPKKRNVGELFILMVTELWEAYDAWQNNAADDKLPEFPGLGVEIGDLLIRVADFAGALAAGRVIAHDPHSDNPGQAMFLEIGEIAERYESIRKTPAALGGPELADFIPATAVGKMIDAKLAFNATRADHKIENRLKDDGKRT